MLIYEIVSLGCKDDKVHHFQIIADGFNDFQIKIIKKQKEL